MPVNTPVTNFIIPSKILIMPLITPAIVFTADDIKPVIAPNAPATAGTINARAKAA